MRLLERLHDGSFALTRNYAKQREVPRYAVLSHTWMADGEDVTYDDVAHGATRYQQKPGYKKLTFCATRAAQDGLQYFWIDSCCIDRANSVELSEAINSMFRWYRRAEQCYALLSDVFVPELKSSTTRQEARSGHQWEAEFVASKWHTRGWCLQELLAPGEVDFYSNQGVWFGNKNTLQELITKATNIPQEALQTHALHRFAIKERMLWAKFRQTSRPEDKAYCLLGILGVFMLQNYGEGRDNAFERLREEISKHEKGREDDPKFRDLLGTKRWKDLGPGVDASTSELCLANTRVQLLKDVDTWIDRDYSPPVFWLNDAAGTGKSTVARTLVRRCYDKGYLGGCFFFSYRGGEASRTDNLFPTLAAQLAAWMPATYRHIADVVSADSTITRRSLRDQWERLILEPLSRVGEGSGPPAVVFILDALDECDNEKDSRTILRLLSRTRELDNIRLRIFITSRPAPHIRTWLQRLPISERQSFKVYTEVPSQMDRDLTLFLENKFSELRHEQTWENGFPSEHTIEQLVSSANGLFVWASTACRYIRDDEQLSRMRLATIAKQHYQQLKSSRSPLDDLYTAVLQDCVPFDEMHSAEGTLGDFVGYVILLFTPLSARALESLLGVPEGHALRRLSHLHAIFDVPQQHDQSIRLHHAAFCDFILDSSRCTDETFQVNQRHTHQQLAKKCVRLMSDSLRKNICSLDSPGTRMNAVLHAHVQHSIPPDVQYACHYWVKHLNESDAHLQDGDEIHRFIQEHFLHWFEAMTLIGKGSEMATVLRMYQALLPLADNTSQLEFIKDARRFVLTFQPIAEQAPLQIYCAGLGLVRRSSLIRQQYQAEMQPWVANVGIAKAKASNAKIEYNYVNDLAFTPDSRKLVSGSIDEFVRVWDLPSRSTSVTYCGQADKISSVAVSSDGLRIASGSDDATVMVRDRQNENESFMLMGHTKWVNTVVFSPDDKILASGSMDETIKLWNLELRSEISAIHVGGGCVNSIAFSPNGAQLASGTNDDTVRLWSVERNEIVLVLDGHKGAVNSVSYSHRGHQLVSGSDDATIRLWDVFDGDELQMLVGHSKSVRAVVFSRDDRRIASGSEDKTIRLWNVASGKEIAALTGHTSGINAVAYTPDGKLLVSCAFDDDVMIWDAESGDNLGRLPEFRSQQAQIQPGLPPTVGEDEIVHQQQLAHAERVTCMITSPDGATVASGSSDHTIKLWEQQKCRAFLGRHSAGITHLAFSPDGTLLASASEDKTAKLWLVNSGTLVHDLQGHTGSVRYVGFSNRGNELATTSSDGTIIIWSLATSRPVHRLEGHFDIVTDIAFAPGDRILASSSADRTARIWDAETGIEVCEPLEGHANSLNSVAFSADGNLLVSSSDDMTIKIWDKEKPGHGTLHGHSGAVRSATFSTDTKMVVSCSDDQTVIIWDLYSRTLQQKISVGVSLHRVSFSQDRRHLATDRGPIRLKYPMMPLERSPKEPELFVTEEWVQQDRRDILWLDNFHRASSVAIANGSAILGHASGAMSFITLRSSSQRPLSMQSRPATPVTPTAH